MPEMSIIVKLALPLPFAKLHMCGHCCMWADTLLT